MFPPTKTPCAAYRQAELQRARGQQLATIRAAGQIARLAQRELSSSHQVASVLCAQTLAAMDRIRQAAELSGNLTPFQQEAITHIQMAYLFEMLATVEQTGDDLVTALAQKG